MTPKKGKNGDALTRRSSGRQDLASWWCNTQADTCSKMFIVRESSLAKSSGTQTHFR